MFHKYSGRACLAEHNFHSWKPIREKVKNILLKNLVPYGIHCPKNQLNKASTCTLQDVGQTSTYHTFLHKAVNNAICNLTSTMHSCMHAYLVYVHLFITPLQLLLYRQRALFLLTSFWHHACKHGCGALQRKGQAVTCACTQAKQTQGPARRLESVVYHHTCY